MNFQLAVALELLPDPRDPLDYTSDARQQHGKLPTFHHSSRHPTHAQTKVLYDVHIRWRAARTSLGCVLDDCGLVH